MIRVVLDTNVLVSAFISTHGPSRHIFKAWRKGEFELTTSAPLLGELNRVLHRRHVQEKYRLREADILAYLGLLRIRGTLVAIPPLVRPICSDPSDDRLLACAVIAQASYLVTGDKEVLLLDRVGAAQIVTPRTFAAQVLGGWQPTLPGIQ